MKKASILSLCVLMGATAFGQTQVVKDAEKAMKDKKPFSEVVKVMTPAFTDPATAKSVDTYYIPGAAGFNTYDDLFAKESLGMLDANGKKQRAEALIGAYDYFMKALPLDSLPDEKGKVKPKRSKDIIGKIGGHFNDFDRVAVDFWGLEDFNSAYRAWDIYCDLTQDPRFAKAIPSIPADTVVADIMYNRSLAAFNGGDMNLALNSFKEAMSKGYNKKSAYDLAISAAYQAGDTTSMIELCEKALPLYGGEDSKYISVIINSYIDAKEYQRATTELDAAIASDPNNIEYYILRGILYELDEIDGDAKAEFAKALQIDPNNSRALSNYGRMLFNEAVAINNEAPNDTEEYDKVFQASIKPLLKEAADYLEQAYANDNDNRDALRVLQQVYYLAQDEANYKKTEDRLNY